MALNSCVFDICSFWSGIFLGLISSLMASGLTYLIVRGFWKRRFGRANGDYKGRLFKKQQGESCGRILEKATWELEDEPVDDVEIRYKRDNILSIKVTSLKDKNEEGQYLVWSGEMTMETENFGSVVWQYENLPKGQHRFGFKRCIVRETDEGSFGKVHVYLIGEEIEGYGKEVLTRKKC